MDNTVSAVDVAINAVGSLQVRSEAEFAHTSGFESRSHAIATLLQAIEVDPVGVGDAMTREGRFGAEGLRNAVNIYPELQQRFGAHQTGQQILARALQAATARYVERKASRGTGL